MWTLTSTVYFIYVLFIKNLKFLNCARIELKSHMTVKFKSLTFPLLSPKCSLIVPLTDTEQTVIERKICILYILLLACLHCDRPGDPPHHPQYSWFFSCDDFSGGGGRFMGTTIKHQSVSGSYASFIHSARGLMKGRE